MMVVRSSTALACCLWLLTLVGCARGYDMNRPPSFRAYEEDAHVKMITADGVMLKVREVENYPKASLSFWSDALTQHLEHQGFAVLGEKKCFKSQSGLEGCTVRFLSPRGAEDWVVSETVFVSGDTIYLVEAAGEFERFSAVEKELDGALATFRLK